MTLGRESIYTLAMLGVTPSIQELLVHNFNLSESNGLIVGALSGSFFAVTLTHPMDTIKTCMQGDVGMQRYQGVIHTAKHLKQEFGMAKGLYKGYTWRLGLVSTTFFLVNKIKETIAPIAFPASCGLTGLET